MMLKILQLFTVILFALIVGFGVGIILAAPDRFGVYSEFVGLILPAWLTSITAALLGKPITEAASGIKAKLAGDKLTPEQGG